MTFGLSCVGLTQTELLTLRSFCTWFAFCFLSLAQSRTHLEKDRILYGKPCGKQLGFHVAYVSHGSIDPKADRRLYFCRKYLEYHHLFGERERVVS